MKRLFLLLLFLPLTGCSPPPALPRPDALTFPPLVFQVPEVEKVALANGMRLYLREDHELPLVEVTAMIGAGAIGEPAEKTGLTSLFAAALRTGGAAERSPEELDEVLERLAADVSVAADTYTTTLDLSLRSVDLAEGLAILADLLRRPAFDAGRLELSRRQMLEGIRRQNDLPGEIASRALMRAIYGDHPLGRTPTEKSVKAVRREDLLAFHRRFFHPNNLYLAISGDFEREDLLNLLNRYFGDWPPAAFTSQAVPPVTAVPKPAVLVADKEIPQTTILMGHLGIDKAAPDLFPVRVMNFILGGGGFNSRLMREVRSNRGLAYSVYSYYQVGRRLPGPFITGAETKSDSTLEVVGLIRNLMAEMSRRPVSGQELSLAKESLINSFVFAFDDSHDVLTRTMVLDYFDYPPDYLLTYRDKVAAVTVEDVQRAAQRHLHPQQLEIVLVGDREAFGGDPQTLGAPVSFVDQNR